LIKARLVVGALVAKGLETDDTPRLGCGWRFGCAFRGIVLGQGLEKRRLVAYRVLSVVEDCFNK